MTKIVLYPTPVTLSKSVLWPSKEKEKKKRKERKKERKKRLILLKYIYSRAKLVKLKVPVIIQDPDSSHIEAIV